MSPNNPFGLQDKVALVTGGSRGIGAAVVEAFALAGARVLIVSRDVGQGQRLVSELTAQGLLVQALACDIGSKSECARAVAQAHQAFGALDIVVHNAATNPWMSVDAMTEEALEQTLAVNLKACFWLLQAAAPGFRERRAGRMLVTSSVTGPRVAMPNSAHYAASKAGVNGFIRSAALEYARDGITVNGVEPGYIAKQGGSLLSDPVRAARIARYIPAGELGRPQDIAYAMLYLASPAARYVTGQTLVVDGGSTLPESPTFADEAST